jgi:hypothetical protein
LLFQQSELEARTVQFFLEALSLPRQLSATFSQDEARELIPEPIDSFRCTDFVSEKKSVVTLLPAILRIKTCRKWPSHGLQLPNERNSFNLSPLPRHILQKGFSVG